ncbi:MAG: chemotaxis protein CheA [Desulfamplus sp.]|nr:chemotaxis protein CheA [Desulfamplus sp.]
MPDITIIQDTTNSQDDRQTLDSILEDISLECVLADIADPESFSKLLVLLKRFFQKAKDCNCSELAEDAKKAGKIVKSIMEHKKSDSLSHDTSSNDKLSDNISDIENQIDSVNLIISEMKSFLHFITQSSTKTPSSNTPEVVQHSDSNIIENIVFQIDKLAIPVAPPPPPSPIGRGNNYSLPLGRGGEGQNNYLESYRTQEVDLDEITPNIVAQEVKIEQREINLSHPGQLPAFLNIEDFAEFLSLQSNTLEKMEVLILDIEKNNNRAYAQGELKRLFHTTKGEAGFLGLKDVEKVCHKAEDLMDTQNFGNIVDTLLAVKDWLESTYSVYAGNSAVAPSIQDILLLFDEDKIALNNADKLNGNQDNVQQSADISDQADKKLNSSEVEEFSSLTNTSPILTESINVDAARLDRMVNIIGELAIAESMVTQSSEIKNIASSTLLRALSSLHKITKELQSLGLSLRMIPLKSLFNRMERVTRDLAKKTGKQIHFVIKGELTELDKTLVDKLGDPLIHLVRNSVDHGVEDSIVERIDAGKSATATIELRAFHKGGYLFIEVEDDGRGINKKRLLEKAISQGVIKPTLQESEKLFSDKLLSDEILNLVFHPGLTTANKITDVSGRGVGMDVVRKSIESCRGKVSISSIEGKGTICTIKIPLTLSIIDGLVVRVGDEVYVIPTLSIVTSLKVDKKDISNVFEKGEMINVLGKLIPLFRLNRLFKLNKGSKNFFSNLNSNSKYIDDLDGVVVVVEDNGFHIALLVDELIGKQNTVIKNLGMGINEIKGVSGGTIMPDGRVSLILDIAGIIDLSHSEP